MSSCCCGVRYSPYFQNGDDKIAKFASYSAAQNGARKRAPGSRKEMLMAVNSLQKQPARGPGRRFEKGRSGTPAGRPPGLRNRATEAAELLLDGEAEALTRKAVEL